MSFPIGLPALLQAGNALSRVFIPGFTAWLHYCQKWQLQLLGLLNKRSWKGKVTWRAHLVAGCLQYSRIQGIPLFLRMDGYCELPDID